MTAQEKLDKIMQAIQAGRTLYIGTYTRCTKIDAACVKRFEKVGASVLKASGNSLYVARGRNWDCIDGCAIRIA